MFRDQFMARDINQQILLAEMLTDPPRDARKKSYSGGGDRCLCDEDPRMEIVLVDEVVECAHLFRSHSGRVGAEFDVHGAAVGDGVGFLVERRVFLGHCFRGAGDDF